MPAVSIETPAPDSPNKLDSNSRELVLQRIRESEDRAKETANDAIEELAAIYERQLAERDAIHEEQMAQRDRWIETLRRGDTTLAESVEQIRAANVRLREEFTAQIASAVTIEVSKRFVTGAEADLKISGAGRLTQVKSTALAIIAALVSSGALVQIAQSCQEQPKPVVPAPAVGPGYGGRT